MEERLRNELAGIIGKCSNIEEEALKKAIMQSKTPKNGDFVIPFSQITRDETLIQTVAEAIVTEGSIIRKVEVIKQMLCIYIDVKSISHEIVSEILGKKEAYGSSTEGEGKTVVIDFSSPNIAKVFHAGHLRTTIIGNYIQNIYKKLGYKTVALNYLGDWGKQFGFLAIGYAKYADQKKMEEDPIRHLNDIYVRMNQEAEQDPSLHDRAREFFKRMEEGDEEAVSVWRNFRELSISKYEEMYASMNIHFDIYSGESFYGGKAALDNIQTKPYLIPCEDGSKIADLGQLGKTVLVKNDGSTIYITRDVLSAQDRIQKYSPHKLIYVVASQQDLHFKQLFKLLEMDGYSPSLFLHINFGMVKGMSTRRGTAVSLADIIDVAQDAVMEKMQESGKAEQISDKKNTSRTLALSAILVQDFKAKRIKDYDFDMKKNTSFIGDTGPYVQYTLCRLASISRNAVYPVGDMAGLDFTDLGSDKCYELLFLLGRYPSVLAESIRGHEPSVIVTYILQICQLVNSIFRVVWVANQPEEIARARLAMYEAIRYVLADAVRILGMKPLEVM
ncbi:arginyl-tRNA synthetase [Nematocida ausubeli]|uniref:arginine--tRNA ligase n=1 Tax=Nematocida ausubeli (strain ATCC PRA-371 / ERTm2) TaxID=1913371 RepID=A0A086J3D3_NEMA1|nr:arginyl-tRNA synthetase [Nematocida ausubeli]KFG26651.1 arginyl-tRNA synthetase [Nematocida ausubeli]